MEYHIVSYVIDSNELKKICGSKNQKIFLSLIGNFEFDLENINEEHKESSLKNENFQQLLSDIFNGETKLSECGFLYVLADIINGETRFPKLGFLYAQIYEILCQSYGKIIIPPSEEFSTDYYWSVTKGKSKTFGFNYKSDDFTKIYCIENSNLETERAKFLALKEVDGITNDEYLEIAKQDFNFAFEEAIKAKKDLVFFVK